MLIYANVTQNMKQLSFLARPDATLNFSWHQLWLSPHQPTVLPTQSAIIKTIDLKLNFIQFFLWIPKVENPWHDFDERHQFMRYNLQSGFHERGKIDFATTFIFHYWQAVYVRVCKFQAEFKYPSFVVIKVFLTSRNEDLLEN